MTLIARCSFKGSPGTTTTALGLAARWPGGGRAVLVECDPAGGDLLARFRLETSPGVVSLAAAVRRSADPEVLWQHAQELPGGQLVVVGPPSAEQATAALGEIATNVGALRRAADEPDAVLVADCGRIDAGSPAVAVVRQADVTVLLARATDDALAHVATRLPSLAKWAARSCFVLVGPGYPTAEVAATLGVPVSARLPYDPKGAAVLAGGHGRRGAVRRSALGRAVGELAQVIAGQSPEPAHRLPEPVTVAAESEKARAVSVNGGAR